jgi:hypothetical protein
VPRRSRANQFVKRAVIALRLAEIVVLQTV